MTPPQNPKRILISQHATIPHYRVRFYELLEQRRPAAWEFDVVFDTREAQNPRLYLEPVNWQAFGFPILDVRTRIFGAGTRGIIWQSFFWRARKYDAVVTDNFVAHLTYMATHLWRFFGVRRGVWGHTRDRQTPANPGRVKRATEWLKSVLFPRYDFFFAYTSGEAQIAQRAGFPAERMVVLHNTIDTTAERTAYEAVREQRNALRESAGFTDNEKVLLYVGRLVADKRIDFLTESFRLAYTADPALRLVIVGDGPLRNVLDALGNELPAGVVTMHGAVSDRDVLAPIYATSDLYFITGSVGLAPLQACCYDLPSVSFDLPTNGPECEYRTSANGIVLPQATTPAQFAAALPGAFAQFASPQARQQIYQSIEHLTIENMVDNFITGVNKMLSKGHLH